MRLNSCFLVSLAMIMTLFLTLNANRVLAMNEVPNQQTTQTGNDGGNDTVIAGFAVVAAAGGHGDRDRDPPNGTVPGSSNRYIIPLSVWAGTATLLCLLISAGWIIEHFVGGDCPDEPTRIKNGTNISSVCPNVTTMFNASSDCPWARKLCGIPIP